MTAARYDTIGVGYARQRRADPRIAAQIFAALGGGTVVNVGAGAGSYEPPSTLVAVEPSDVMIAQRPHGSAPVVRAVAEHLPLPDRCADAGLASMTVHHWGDPARGLAELVRVAPARTVVFAWDASVVAAQWLFTDYFPQIPEREAHLPDAGRIAAMLTAPDRSVRVEAVPVPADCTDGFAGAYWSRPEAILDPAVRQANSGMALLDPAVREAAVERLRADLASGAWRERHGHLLDRTEIDAGLRLVVATRPNG